MQPTEYLAGLRRGWWLLLVGLLLGLLGSLAYTRASPDTYEATVSVYFTPARGETVAELSQGSTYTQSLMPSFARLAVEPDVLRPVIDDLNLSVSPRQLASRVTAEAPIDTLLLAISASSERPEEAAAIADAVGRQLRIAVEELTPPGDENIRPIRVTTLAAAQVPSSPIAPSAFRNGVLGLALGLALGVTAVFVRELLNDDVRDADQIEQITGLPVLDSMEQRVGAGRVTVSAGVARRLRTTLLAAPDPSPGGRTLLVTSSVRDRGGSGVAAHLAASFAESGSRVLLVDGDLRRPTVATIFDITESTGLSDVVHGGANMTSAARSSDQQGLDLLPAGASTDDPGAVLASPSLRSGLLEASRVYDVVIINAPPVGESADALVLGQLVSGVLLVLDTRRIRRSELARHMRTLRLSGVPLLGCVLNKTRTQFRAWPTPVRLSSPTLEPEPDGVARTGPPA